MDTLIEQYAARMGMKPHREVLEVVPVDDGHAVRTHDGQWTLIRADGSLGHRADAPAAPIAAIEPEPEPEPAATPAPKRRSRA